MSYVRILCMLIMLGIMAYEKNETARDVMLGLLVIQAAFYVEDILKERNKPN